MNDSYCLVSQPLTSNIVHDDLAVCKIQILMICDVESFPMWSGEHLNKLQPFRVHYFHFRWSHLWGLKKHIKMPTFPLSLYFGFHSPVVSGAQGELRRSQRFPVVNKNYDKLPSSLLCNVSTHKFSLRFEFFATASL